MTEHPAPADSPPPARRVWGTGPILAVAVAFVLAYFLGARFAVPREASSPPGVRPTSTLVVAVRDLARLETTELHVEKVIDLTDTQSRFFGLVQATDAMLLVASGDVTVGVDLGKVSEGDLTMDADTKRATVRLPPPEIFSTRLDEDRTYVYARSTSLLARRNEHLETRARQEAVNAIGKAALEGDVMDRAKRQAEKELRPIVMALGATDVSILWK